MTPKELSDTERELVNAWRTASEYDKETIAFILRNNNFHYVPETNNIIPFNKINDSLQK